MKILVTGATGFIGSHLCAALHAHGHELVALVRPQSTNKDRVPPAARIQLGDLLEPLSLAAACEGVDAVIHCGALVGVTDHEDAYQRVNVGGTISLLEAAADAGVQRTIILSTGSVLGPTTARLADASTPLAPSSAYARSKAESERRSWTLATRIGLPLVVARPPWVYGPSDLRTLGLYRAILRRWPMPWRGSDVSVHPVHVDDLVKGLEACLLAFPRVVGRTYHLAGPEPMPISRVIPVLAGALGVRPPPHLPRGPTVLAAKIADRISATTGVPLPITTRRLAFFLHANAFDLERERQDFGYAPDIHLEQGMQGTIAWCKGQGLLDG